MTELTSALKKRLAAKPDYVQEALRVYRQALNAREDWHTAVEAAVEAAIAVREGKA